MKKVLENVLYFWSKTNRWHRILLLLMLAELEWLPGSRLGFMCNDPALSHPYKGDTISWKWLLSVTITLPFIFILIVERKYHGENVQQSKERALTWYKEYVYGLALNLTTLSVMKGVIGEPRPHFFDTCAPKEAETCVGSQYISTYTCTRELWVAQSERSFPSGHTSLSLHAAGFIVWYLTSRVPRTEQSSYSTRIAQVLPPVIAIICALSRLTDRRHHWWDVGAGVVLAAASVCYTVFVLCKNFESDAQTRINESSDQIKVSPTKRKLETNASIRKLS